MTSRPSPAADPFTPNPTETTTPNLSEDPTPTSPYFTESPSPAPQPSPEEPTAWSPTLDDVADPDPGSDSSPRSTSSSAARRAALRGTFKGAVRTIGGFLHVRLTAPGTPHRAEGMWLPDENDQKAIAEPLASLASRRAPEGAVNPDVADLATLVIAVVDYVQKQLALARDIAQVYAAPVPDQGAEEPS